MYVGWLAGGLAGWLAGWLVGWRHALGTQPKPFRFCLTSLNGSTESKCRKIAGFDTWYVPTDVLVFCVRPSVRACVVRGAW